MGLGEGDKVDRAHDAENQFPFLLLEERGGGEEGLGVPGSASKGAAVGEWVVRMFVAVSGGRGRVAIESLKGH